MIFVKNSPAALFLFNLALICRLNAHAIKVSGKWAAKMYAPLKFVLPPLTHNSGYVSVSASLSVSGSISFAPSSRMGSGIDYYGLEPPNHMVIERKLYHISQCPNRLLEWILQWWNKIFHFKTCKNTEIRNVMTFNINVWIPIRDRVCITGQPHVRCTGYNKNIKTL